MYRTDDDTQGPAAEPFPLIRGALRRRRLIVGAGTALPALLLIWLALRTGVPDFLIAAPIASAVTYGVLSLALEVVDLVAETLMPR
ncbi:hypothetical protein FOZ76_16795 [Verticiella sediminum]|uniref:Uncharacterized protein n=1 Tax=Verticiella sediminum TaxID=1247510 RepID=A0A556AJG8_9BURK|nr:hypothetical protein [Verticiella sediminum]TSH93042.1 hypothetical protein FOZ76_16795 [Verticiella sediminum]